MSLSRTDRVFFLANAVVSVSAVAFIGFILRRDAEPAGGLDVAFLPGVNALLNALSASCLIAGYAAIRRRAVVVHRALMIAAFVLSSLFLAGYLTYNYVHGDTRFTGTGAMRVVYFFILITHILLSVTVVPLALTSFYFAFTRAFDRHRRLNRVFLPICRSGCTFRSPVCWCSRCCGGDDAGQELGPASAGPWSFYTSGTYRGSRPAPG
jgi:putative membrane protein